MARIGRRERGVDYWPGFVDALSTLVLAIVFLLTVFMVAQFFLSQQVTDKDTALQNSRGKFLSSLISLHLNASIVKILKKIWLCLAIR